MKPLTQSMMLPLRFSRYAMLSESASMMFKYNGVIHWFETHLCLDRVNKGEDWVICTYLLCDCGLSYCTAPLPMWRPSFQSGPCVALVLLCGKLVTVAVVKQETEGQCQLSKNGRPGRADRVEPKTTKPRIWHGTRTALHWSGQRHLNTDIHLHPLSTLVLAHPLLPNSIMPAHRHSLNRSFTCSRRTP